MEKIIIPSSRIRKPVVDCTEFENGQVVFLLCWLGKALWVSQVLPAREGRVLSGWMALEHPPIRIEPESDIMGILFSKRRYAIEEAEKMIDLALKRLFR